MKTGEKNPPEERGKGAKKAAENPQNRATTREFNMWQKKQKTRSRSVKHVSWAPMNRKRSCLG